MDSTDTEATSTPIKAAPKLRKRWLVEIWEASLRTVRVIQGLNLIHYAARGGERRWRS